MKKGLIIVGEIVVVLAILVFIKVLLNNYWPATANHVAISFIFFCIAGMISVFIYHLNTKNK